CDGQVLVTHDLLGLFDRFTPKFVKKYANIHDEMSQAFAGYTADVLAHQFPAPEHAHQIEDEEFRELLAELEAERV
ncbi:MAG: 3-methyl-2-oxobutanoate hydroxymethyltransferase, partial [Anaerolineales bacterium]